LLNLLYLLSFFKRKITYEFAPRREGDVAICYADPSLAEKELGWKATLGIDRVCEISLIENN
jgi:UDP-glucose 4-epimerase